MIDFKDKKILVLAPHTDDGELGCGGMIDKAIKDGASVTYTAFSVCEQSVPYGFDEESLLYELMEAMQVFGIPTEKVIVHRYPVRRFKEFRQDILQDIIDNKKDIDPDIVFLPCLTDIHQDHQVIAEEGLRAYKDRTIMSYELPWNNLSLETSAFVRLTQDNVDMKIKALKKYKTQGFRQYTAPKFIEALAHTRGVQIGSEYAEAYQIVRLVI